MFKWLKSLFAGAEVTKVEPKEEIKKSPAKKAAPKKAAPKKAAPKKAAPKKTPAVKKTTAKPAKQEPAVKVEKGLTLVALGRMTKAQLEEKGREFGIEVDRRKKKDDIVQEVFNASSK
jgi:hypothetical protein